MNADDNRIKSRLMFIIGCDKNSHIQLQSLILGIKIPSIKGMPKKNIFAKKFLRFFA